MADWLEQEMQMAAAAIRQPHRDRLRALGCMGNKVAQLASHFPPFGTMRVQRRKGDLYEPCEAGTNALIMPVCWPEVHTGLISPSITLWRTLDLIAFRADRPAHWLWRTGNGWALGGGALENWQGEPVVAVATPLDWLRAGGEALCVLDWSDDSPVWPKLRCVSAIHASDDLLARRLAQAIDRTTHRPTITVSEVLRHAA